MKKNIFLALIASVGLMSAVFADEGDTQKEEPSPFTERLSTILIPGGATIGQHIRWERDEYKEHSEYAHFVEMNKIPIFQVDDDGSIEKIMTLGDMRYSLHGNVYSVNDSDKPNPDKDLYTQGYRSSLWFGMTQDLMHHNNAVKCPKVVAEYSNRRWWYTTIEKVEDAPLAIVVGKPTTFITDCDLCEKIKQYYIKQAQQNQK